MHYYNFFILSLHTCIVTLITLLCLKLGKQFLIAYLALLAVLMNLFVLKQINLFGLNITCSDALAVGYLLGLNLIQEFFGKSAARTMVWIGFLTAITFLFLSQIHLLYYPNQADTMHSTYNALLKPQIRIIFASLISFLAVQLLDIRFFSYLRKKLGKNHLAIRTSISLLLSEGIDTVLFSFLGLAGLVDSIWHIILFSFLAKLLVIALSLPFLDLSRRMHVQV